MKYNKEYVDNNPDLEFTTFWKPQEKNGFMSQWWRTKIIDNDGTIYNCAEQYMMAQKAILFKDREVYHLIMTERNPSEMKRYGRMIRDFDSNIWDKHKYDIVLAGNLYKFRQNQMLKKMLLETGNSILVEASPYDEVWGIKSQDISKWNGQNLLGFILMEVRDAIK